MNKEIDKLDDIDRRVVLWCAINQAQHIEHVLAMYHRDYRVKGIFIDLEVLTSEVKEFVEKK